MVLSLRQYLLPVLLAVALHAALAVWLQGLWGPSATPERVFKPRIVNSTLLVLEPKPEPKPKVTAPPKPAPAVTELV